MEPIFSLRDVEVRQGARFTLAIESLDLQACRIYAFTGPNGAGKSTLLRTLALLTPPNRGKLNVGGRSIRKDPASLAKLRRQITLVEQSPYLFKGSVYSNLAFGLRIRGIRGKEQHRRIASALETVGLAGFEQRKACELSGGEVQRVALARALVLQPKVLLLDEPTSNIDSKSLQDFERLIATLPQQGITVILSTHDPIQPQRLGGEVIRIKDGRLQDPPHAASGHKHPQTTEKTTWLRPLKAQGL